MFGSIIANGAEKVNEESGPAFRGNLAQRKEGARKLRQGDASTRQSLGTADGLDLVF